MTIHRRALNDQEAALLGAFRDLSAEWQEVLSHAIDSLAHEEATRHPGRWPTDQMHVTFSASAPDVSDGTRGVYFIREEEGGAGITAIRVPVIRQEDYRSDVDAGAVQA